MKKKSVCVNCNRKVHQAGRFMVHSETYGVKDAKCGRAEAAVKPTTRQRNAAVRELRKIIR